MNVVGRWSLVVGKVSRFVIPIGLRPCACEWSKGVAQPAVLECANALRATVRAAQVVLVMALSWAVGLQAEQSSVKPCDMTKPNGSDRYGSAALSTVLFPEGTIEFRPDGPGFVLPDGSLQMKFPWWKQTRKRLTITGRRLDASAPPLRAEIGESTDFHMVPTYIIFPTEGCWEVTGKAGDATLLFVTRVVKIGRGP